MRGIRYVFPLAFVFLMATGALAQVVFFEDYDGRGASFRAGMGNRASLPGNWNDRISSVRVDDGYVLILYEHFNFQGRTETVVGRRGGTLTNLQRFNDAASSYRVRRDRPGAAPPSDTPDYPQGPVTFFENFKGDGPRFSDSRDRSNLSGRWNDRVSAVWVAEGYEATVYEHFNFEGKSRRLSGRRGGALYDLRDFNDQVSSYRIRRGHYDDGYGSGNDSDPYDSDPYYSERPYYGTGTATGSQCFVGAAAPSLPTAWLRDLASRWFPVARDSARPRAGNGPPASSQSGGRECAYPD